MTLSVFKFGISSAVSAAVLWLICSVLVMMAAGRDLQPFAISVDVRTAGRYRANSINTTGLDRWSACACFRKSSNERNGRR